MRRVQAPSFLRTLALLGVVFAAVLTVSAQEGKDIDNKPGTAAPGAPAPAVPAPATDESSAAGAVAQSFFDDYIRNLKRLGSDKARLAWVLARKDVTPQFKAAYQRAHAKAAKSKMGGMEADPFLNAQDYPDNSTMVVTGAQLQGTKAKVTMNWRQGMDLAVEVKLLKFPDGWKIHGIGDIVAK